MVAIVRSTASGLLAFLTLAAAAPFETPEFLEDDPPESMLQMGSSSASVAPAVFPIIPSRLREPPLGRAKPLAADQDLLRGSKKGADGHYYLNRDGADRRLTLDPSLQEKLTRVLEIYQTPYAAVVVLDPSSGRVLAMAEHSERDPQMRGLPTKAVFPAASIFKIVTASALLDEGVSPDESECFHGGKRRISEKLLQDTARDQNCLSLSTAFAKSANLVFAKLTQKYLSADQLRRRAEALYFNQPIDFPVATEMSLAGIPDDLLGLASAGSGFGDVYLSPLHAASIAAVIASGGLWHAPILFEDQALGNEGVRVISEDNARGLAEMMERTIAIGTARRIFHQRGWTVDGAAGKTGCLGDRKPFRDYSWFVGFAPKSQPSVAVAAVIVNDLKWRIRATYLAREAMRLALAARLVQVVRRP